MAEHSRPLAWSNLCHRYLRGAEIAFAAMALEPGQHMLLRGPSGSGKSTLLALLAGLLSPSQGRVEVAGRCWQDLRPAERDAWRGAQLGFVPQRQHLSASLSVRDNLALPHLCAGLKAEPERAQQLLQQLGLANCAERRPHQLSVGQAQRVALARALMRRPQLLLADEPSANLDDEAAARMLELLKRTAAGEDLTLVLATHDGRIQQALGGLAGWRELSLPAWGEAEVQP